MKTKIKKLFPGTYSGVNTNSSPQVKNFPETTRRSERQKKPSSRWTEEAGYLALPSRSGKKKGSGAGSSSLSPEGTNPQPLSISDWSDVQLDKFCSACGIVLVDLNGHKEECLAMIHNSDCSIVAPVRSPAIAS